MFVCYTAEAVRKNPVTSKASNLEVECCIKKWLRNAIDRMGGRCARMKQLLAKKQQAATTRSPGNCLGRDDGTDSCSNDDLSYNSLKYDDASDLQ